MKFEVTHSDNILTLTDSTVMESKQLSLSLTKKLEHYNFLPPAVKAKWNGIVSYFHKDKYVPIGLWKEIKYIAETYKYPLEIKGLGDAIFYKDVTRTEFENWVDDMFTGAINDKGEPFYPYDYQINAAYNILINKICISELTTAAGKSLIIFICLAFFQEKGISEKILMIVPSIDLVIQAYEDFNEYNSFLLEENRIPLNIKQIHGGEKKDFKATQNIHISTFQSLGKFQPKYFTVFDTVVVDECLHPDSLITMSDNSKKKISEVKIGDSVWTTNDITGDKEIKNVDYIYKNLSSHEEIYELELEDGSVLELTGNHKVKLTNQSYKRVDELDGTEDIINNLYLKIKKITKRKYKGDVYNLRIECEDGNNHNYFANDINVSNCHRTKSNTIRECIGKCINSKRRFGLTGTTPKQGTLDSLTLQAYLGPTITKVTAKELQEKGTIADVDIAIVEFQYPEDVQVRFDRLKKELSRESKGKLLKLEQDFVIQYEPRTEVIGKIINKVSKNQLVLFHRQEYGKRLKKYLEENTDKEIYFIYGEIKKDDRADIKKLMKSNTMGVKEVDALEFDIGINKYRISCNEFIKLTNGNTKKVSDLEENDDIDENSIKNFKV